MEPITVDLSLLKQNNWKVEILHACTELCKGCSGWLTNTCNKKIMSQPSNKDLGQGTV